LTEKKRREAKKTNLKESRVQKTCEVLTVTVRQTNSHTNQMGWRPVNRAHKAGTDNAYVRSKTLSGFKKKKLWTIRTGGGCHVDGLRRNESGDSPEKGSKRGTMKKKGKKKQPKGKKDPDTYTQLSGGLTEFLPKDCRTQGHWMFSLRRRTGEGPTGKFPR